MIKKTDWHYKLANFGSKRVWGGYDINFCNYFWCVVFGALHLIALIIGIAIASLLVFGSLYEFYMWCVYNNPMSEGAITVIVILFTTITTLSIGYCIYKYLSLTEDSREEKRRVKREQVKEPSFFEMAYRKFKDKTCFKIKVEE